MLIGERIRTLRTEKGLSQGDIERASGLLRCYTSRVENGHTVPALETLERFASALGVPLYQLFYEGNGAPATPQLSARLTLEELAEQAGEPGSEARFLLKVRSLLGSIRESDREVLLSLARKLAFR
ncbi:MAG: helix-turn-helix domain-containing protein [Acidobacteriia bacterium]|nr:helix-turn-helix domain-containing protein [Terriglobia bacterium]